MRGTMIFFDGGRGYGFARPEGGGADVFIGDRDIVDGIAKIKKGSIVSFDLGSNANGKPKALNVIVLDDESKAA